MKHKFGFNDNAEVQQRKMAEFADKILRGRTMIAGARKALADTAKANSNPTVANVLHENYRTLGKVLEVLNKTISDIERRLR